jgi:3-methylcrotonyl-CoA carboxylase beta subunit
MDPGTRAFEVGTFVNDGVIFGDGLRSPAAGVVTAFAASRVGGAWSSPTTTPSPPARGGRARPRRSSAPRPWPCACASRRSTWSTAAACSCPSSRKAFPGATGAGHIFKMNSLLSANGVPQLAGVFGDCIAGGGYMPIISDRVYMTEQAYMVIAGAALIKGAKSRR